VGVTWPGDAARLAEAQSALAAEHPAPWEPPAEVSVGAAWVCFPRGHSGPGAAGDPAWSAAVVMRGRRVLAQNVRAGATAGPYLPGLLALRCGALLEQVVRGLAVTPDVLLLDATGRDHPRRCGLACQLGSVLDLPTIGVTHRPLKAHGEWPPDRQGATAPLRIDDEVVGCWLRSRAGTRPLAVHPGWRTELDTAARVVALAGGRWRTPEPLRSARRLARRARDAAGG